MSFGPCFGPRARDPALLAATDAARREIVRLARRAPRAWVTADCMTRAEVAQGRRITAGHGLYDGARDRVAINRDMDPEMLYLNFIHEHLHRVFPGLGEDGIRVLTQLVDCRVRTRASTVCAALDELTEPWRPYH